jgi:hypothetical protein
MGWDLLQEGQTANAEYINDWYIAFWGSWQK